MILGRCLSDTCFSICSLGKYFFSIQYVIVSKLLFRETGYRMFAQQRDRSLSEKLAEIFQEASHPWGCVPAPFHLRNLVWEPSSGQNVACFFDLLCVFSCFFCVCVLCLMLFCLVICFAVLCVFLLLFMFVWLCDVVLFVLLFLLFLFVCVFVLFPQTRLVAVQWLERCLLLIKAASEKSNIPHEFWYNQWAYEICIYRTYIYLTLGQTHDQAVFKVFRRPN